MLREPFETNNPPNMHEKQIKKNNIILLLTKFDKHIHYKGSKLS